MRISFFWGGFRIWVDAGLILQLISAIEQGRTAIQTFLDQQNLGWLGVFVSVLSNWGAGVVRQLAATCGGRAVVFTVLWSEWNAYRSCA